MPKLKYLRHTGDTFGSHLRRYTTPRHYAGAEWPEFFPVYSHHRDSGDLDESNWTYIVRELGAVDAEQDDSQVWTRARRQPGAIIVREGNPFTGWGEWVGVQDNRPDLLAKADEILGALESYPVLDDEDFSRREWETATERWRGLSLRERIDMIDGQEDVSLFSVRRDEIPSGEDGSIFQALTAD